MKRTAVVLAVSLLGFGTALLLWPRDRITAESWQKIRIGMTEEEVAEILGGPGMVWEEARLQNARLENELGRPLFEFKDPSLDEREMLPWPPPVVCDRSIVWTGRRGRIRIELNQNNHVCWKSFQGLRWRNGSIIDDLRDWLGW